MKKLSLTVNVEDLRIEQDDNGEIKYLVGDDLIKENPFEVLIYVDRKTFIECFHKFDWVLDKGWDSRLQEEYKEIEKFLKETS